MIFLDVNLPGISGPETARRLRAQQPDGDFSRRLIATTAYTGEEVRATCLAAGLTGFLAKPLTLAAIRDALAVHVATTTPPAPDNATQHHPRLQLARLCLLAEHRGTTLAVETNRYLRELNLDGADLGAALVRRDRTACHQTAHRLTGRLAFIDATTESAQARRLADMAELGTWRSLEMDSETLLRTFPVLTARLQALVRQ